MVTKLWPIALSHIRRRSAGVGALTGMPLSSFCTSCSRTRRAPSSRLGKHLPLKFASSMSRGSGQAKRADRGCHPAIAGGDTYRARLHRLLAGILAPDPRPHRTPVKLAVARAFVWFRPDVNQRANHLGFGRSSKQRASHSPCGRASRKVVHALARCS